MDALKMQWFKPIEIEVLDEYINIMSPVAIALDKPQGAEHCYLGLLMPTVQQVRRKLIDMIYGVIHSRTLIDGLIDSISRRFRYLLEFNSSSYVFAAAAIAHPNFKLR